MHKNVASGPLDNKKVFDMPYSISGISKNFIENQGIKTEEDAIKYFPSARLQYRGGPDIARPQTRGIQAGATGNDLWDGFYVFSMTHFPMAMFESLQIQNGVAGSLYGGIDPAGMFLYTRKRPVESYASIWADYTSRDSYGTGIDISDKFEKFGYRAVLWQEDGEREPRNSRTNRRLASFALDFYPLDNLIFETNFSWYRHLATGYYNGVNIPSTAGVASKEPNFDEAVQNTADERFLKTATASIKFKYIPFSALYLEGGYQYQKMSQARRRWAPYNVPSAFVKAQSEFQTGFVSHNVVAAVNGYRWSSITPILLDMRNISLVYDIGLGEHVEVIFSGANIWFMKQGADGEQKGYKKNGVSWAGSIIYKIIPNHLNMYFTYADTLTAGASKSYVADMYQNHPNYGQTISYEPYRSEQYEVGVKARVAEIDLSAALFQITRPTYYEVDLVFEKQGEQRNRGVEFTAGGKIIEYLSVYGGLTYLDAKMNKSNPKNKDVEGKIMIGEPQIQTNVLFDFAVPYTDKLAFTTNFHYTGKRYIDEMNTKSVDGYFTMDIGARYISKSWFGKETTIRLNVDNVFNKKHWVSVFPSSLDGELKNSGTHLFRGYNRTFMLSGQVKF